MAKEMYAISDLVSVTQAKFADRVAPYALANNGTLVILKNAIDYNLPCWNLEKRPNIKKNYCRFGWVGGIHHEVDVRQIEGVFHSVNQKVGIENVFWGMYGKPPIDKEEDKWQEDVWRNYERILCRGMRSNRHNYKVFPALSYTEYGRFYTQIDVAIAPLEFNDFNDSKSEIKIAECGRYNVPLVATDCGCYNEVIKNWETGVLIPKENPKSDWIRVLTRIAKDKKLRDEMGRNLREITDKHFDLNVMVQYRLDLYKALLGMESNLSDAYEQSKQMNHGI